MCIFHLFSFGNSTCPGKNKQKWNGAVRERPGWGQDDMAVPWQLPLRLSAMQASWCPPSEVTFWDGNRTLWTFLLLSWNQIRFQTKLIKSRAVTLTPTLGIPCLCCGVLKTVWRKSWCISQQEKKQYFPQWLQTTNYSSEDTDGVDHGHRLFSRKRSHIRFNLFLMSSHWEPRCWILQTFQETVD